ncbi:MAG: Maf family protein [Candidatus Omnitrophota bacterium]
MRKVILASKSKARQALLKQVGLKFTVAESYVKESRALKRGCADLVIGNALKKAKEVAGRFDSGLVIGADTVVSANGKIIGKPRNVKDAFKTIKILSKRPQWVYTGIAVVDIDNRSVSKAYEKTRVYMRALSDRQIRNYIKKARTLDKAGSFDIQGLGGFFIERIEGCFYNVVGLPLAKLGKILEEAGLDILSY